MASVDIERHRGDSYSETFTVTAAAGAPVDLSSASARFTVKAQTSDEQAEAVLTRTSAGGGIILTATGVVTVTFVAAAMAAISPGRYVYDLEVTLSDGTVHTVADGWFTLLADVST